MTEPKKIANPAADLSTTKSRAFDELFSLVYEDLRRMAHRVRRNDQRATVNTLGLVHEAWLRMRRSPELAARPEPEFKSIAAKAMRQLLIEAARRRNALKRGGKEVMAVPYDEALDHGSKADDELLALDLALHDLERVDPRLARVVEYHYFGGMSMNETAAMLGIAPTTAERDWRAAKARLAMQIKRGRV